jgi:acetoin utilization deacetylase AcuC-like enzyme
MLPQRAGLRRNGSISVLESGVRLVRRQWRRAMVALRPPRVRFVYDPMYDRHLWGVPLDPLRADRILAFLAEEGLVSQEEISTPRPAAMKNLLLAHTPEYVETLQRATTLTSILGTPVGEEERERILDLQRLMVGGTIQATRIALASGNVGVNLGGGFHHALADRGMGFCIFNDIVVAVRRLRRRGFAGRVLVVDLDLHDGNGTRAAFASDPTVHTFSIHNDHWGDTDAVESTSIALGAGVGDDAYLSTLLKTLPPLVERFAPALIIFIAGCDVATDDALGNWRMSADGVMARDRLVAELAFGRRVPLVVLLGGGYGDEAWRYSARFFAWLLARRTIEPPDNEELTLLRFRQIKARLDPLALTSTAANGDWGLTEEDLVGIVPGVPRQTRFLNYYSKVGVELMLERFGIFHLLRAKGFTSPTLQLDLDHPLGQTLRVYNGGPGGELLMETRVNRSVRAVPDMEVLVVEWLLLQNPRSAFPAHRPPLPGQQHPGLGILTEVFGWLVVMCESLQLDGIFVHPSHFHIAAVSRKHLRFLHPEHEALFRALADVLAGVPLATASRALETGEVWDVESGQPVFWGVHPMVLPVSPRLRQLVEGEAYEERVAAAGRRLEYRPGGKSGAIH